MKLGGGGGGGGRGGGGGAGGGGAGGGGRGAPPPPGAWTVAPPPPPPPKLERLVQSGQCAKASRTYSAHLPEGCCFLASLSRDSRPADSRSSR
jgi:hypothetical protein